MTRWKLGVAPFRICAALVCCLLAAACQTTSMGGEVKEVAEADQPLVFNGPGLEGGYRSFTIGDPTGARHKVLLAAYGPVSGSLPRAGIHLMRAAGGMHFTKRQSSMEVLELWNYFQGKNPAQISEGVAVNSIGAIEFSLARTSDSLSCLGFIQYFGNVTDAGLGTSRLSGYYCAPEGVTLTEADGKSILGTLKLKESF